MMMSRVLVLQLLICIIISLSAVQAQFDNVYEGDARLVNGTTASEGILQVYLYGSWNYVCQMTTAQTAFTACKQLGYTNFTKYTETINPQVNSSVIMGINCPPVWDLEDEGEVFLQRCQVGPVQEYDPTACTGVVRIQCDNTLAPYDGQVRTVNDKGLTASLLEIYFEGQWRPLCISKNQMSDFIANSACRQLGFTSSRQYNALDNPNSMSSWRVSLLSDSRCSSNGRHDPHPSYACFTNCMDPSVGYSGVDDCDEDYSQYELLCQFNKTEESLYSAGNPLACVGFQKPQLDIAFYSVLGMLLVMSKITMTLGIMVIVLCCVLHRHQRRSRIRRLNDKASTADAAVDYGATEKQRLN